MDHKKKILIFIPEFPSRSETFVEREVTKLIQLGRLDVVVLALKRGDNLLSEEAKCATSYKRLGARAVLKAVFLIATRLSKVCIVYSKVCGNKNRSLAGNLYVFLKALGYAQIFAEFEPDLIYCHFMSEPSTIVYIASQMLGVPYAISAHAKDILQERGPDKSENVELPELKIKNARFVCVCNKHAWSKAVVYAGPDHADKVQLKYHGVDFEKLLNWKTASVQKPDKPLIFTNGRFTEKKGHRYLIEASKILKDRGVAHVVYIFGGPGDYYENTLKDIKTYQVEDTVKIIGGGKGLPFDEVLPYYKIADVFSFPGIVTETGDSDGIATVLVEAAAFKLPIVATDAGSTQDLVQNDQTGLVVSQKNAYELADKLELLILDKEMGRRLGENAYNRAREMFDLDRNAREIEDLLIR